MEPRAVDYVYYSVSDVARAAAFYRDVLGLTVTHLKAAAGFTLMPWAELQVGSLTVALVGTSGAPAAEIDLSSPWPEHRWAVERPPYFEPPRGEQRGGATVMLAVHDVQATVEELRAKGVPIIMELTESPACFLALVADPDGNRVGLHQRKNGTAG